MEFVPSGEKKFLLAHCHVKEEPLTDELKAQFPADSVFQGLNKVVLMEPPAPNGNGTDCICNSGTAPAVVTLLFLFSVCVQAAEGLSFGIVPYISRPALGVVSGMVGAGGNLGAVIGSSLIVAPTYPTDEGFINLGIVIMSFSLLMFVVYFPDKGGMLVKAGGLGSYDPQIIKPAADMRGADQMNYDDVKPTTKTADA